MLATPVLMIVMSQAVQLPPGSSSSTNGTFNDVTVSGGLTAAEVATPSITSSTTLDVEAADSINIRSDAGGIGIIANTISFFGSVEGDTDVTVPRLNADIIAPSSTPAASNLVVVVASGLVLPNGSGSLGTCDAGVNGAVKRNSNLLYKCDSSLNGGTWLRMAESITTTISVDFGAVPQDDCAALTATPTALAGIAAGTQVLCTPQRDPDDTSIAFQPCRMSATGTLRFRLCNWGTTGDSSDQSPVNYTVTAFP